MKFTQITTITILPLIIFSTVAFSAKQPITKFQSKMNKTSKSSEATEFKKSKVDTCQQISESLRNIRAISTLKQALKKIDKRQFKDCESQLKKDVVLVKSIKQIFHKVKKQGERKNKQSMRSFKSKAAGKQLKINQRITRLRAKGDRLLRARAMLAPGLVISSSGSAPTGRASNSATLQPETIAPGISAYIEANGLFFGDSQGTVELRINSRIYNVDIVSWESDWIWIHYPTSITGVPEVNNATLKVKTKAGINISLKANFIPTYKNQYLWHGVMENLEFLDIFNFTGMSGDFTMFDGKTLNNHWKVVNFNLSDLTESNCNEGSPFMNIGGRALSSQVTWSRGWSDFAACSLEVTVQGPKGIDSGMPEQSR